MKYLQNYNIINIILFICAFSQKGAYPVLEKVESDLRLEKLESAIYELLLLLKSTSPINENEALLKNLKILATAFTLK